MVRGRILYVPKVVLEELKDIKLSFNIEKNSFALERMAKNSKIARKIIEIDKRSNKKVKWIEGMF